MTKIFTLLFALSSLSFAAEKTVHWSDLDSLIAGKNVIVRVQEGKQVKGRAVAVGSDSIMVRTDAGDRSVQRSSLREIRIPKRSGYKWRTIGAAIGAGAGAAIAVPVLSETHNEGSGNYDAAAAGLVLGLAALGFLSGWSADRSGDVIHVLPD